MRLLLPLLALALFAATSGVSFAQTRDTLEVGISVPNTNSALLVWAQKKGIMHPGSDPKKYMNLGKLDLTSQGSPANTSVNVYAKSPTSASRKAVWRARRKEIPGPPSLGCHYELLQIA